MSASLHNRHFLYRRIHSLLGLVPLGIFMVFHLWQNSQARLGAAHYNALVAKMAEINYLLVFEATLVVVPLLLHAAYGLVILGSGTAEPLRYSYRRNWLYWLQRMSGIAMIAFVALHLGLTRIAAIIDPSIYNDMYSHMQHSLSQPVTFGVYMVGLWLSVFHLANGLATAAITWGLTTNAAAQRRFGLLCIPFGLVLGALGTQGLIGFVL